MGIGRATLPLYKFGNARQATSEEKSGLVETRLTGPAGGKEGRGTREGEESSIQTTGKSRCQIFLAHLIP